MDFLQDFFFELNDTATQARLLATATGLAAAVLAAWTGGFLFRRIVSPIILKIITHMHTEWDEHVFDYRVLDKLSRVVQGVIFYLLLPLSFVGGTKEDCPYLLEIFLRTAQIYVTVSVARLFCTFLTNVGELANKENDENSRHYLKSITQFLRLATIFLAVVSALSYAFGRSPLSLIAGLGAAATVFAFIFKDLLLGLVSGIQLSANKMIKPGDWITMSKYDVNGFVEEVSLVTVKIRNFDNTISTIPPYTLVSDSFRNWKGMADGGGRRVKRALYVDISSVSHATPQRIRQWQKEGLLDEHFAEEDTTNLTAFRHYIESYLHRHPKVNTSRWVLARQLDPTPHGLPLELYFYFTEREFVHYEHLAASCMEHFISMMPKFGLRSYQAPTGHDFELLAKGS